MSRGSLIVKANVWDEDIAHSLHSSSHGAGRKLSRTDTLKHWHSLKRAEKDEYREKFSELLQKNGEFESGVIQEMDFAYKNSDSILESQKYLIPVTETTPIVTVKFTSI
jgi:tRNA-splicing ligase RtcB/release factor H-coupled RctB family protein